MSDLTTVSQSGPVREASMNVRPMKLRKLSSLRYAVCDLDFFWRRGSEARVTFPRGLSKGDPMKQTTMDKFPRRRFMRAALSAATVTCLPSSLWSGDKVIHGGAASISTNADAMEEALAMLAGLAPLTNHGPMAAEALVALGRAESVTAFVESYKKRFTDSFPATHQPVTRANWRAALGEGRRVADWINFFQQELKEAAWPRVLEAWTAALAPGLSAAAAHGLIRTGHAVRSLAVKETELRRRELAEGLGYWAAYYQTLPETALPETALPETAPDASNTEATQAKRLRPAEAIGQVPLLPAEKRARGGSIMVGLRSLHDFPPFAATADLVETSGAAGKFLSEVTETFATVYAQHVTPRNFITLIHSVTGATALRSLLPYLSPATTLKALRYGWQASAALYSISGGGSPNALPAAKEIKRDDLIDRAVATREEHAIKFTEACLREHALNPNPIYLQAAQDALGRL
jgi:questin oxidase-like protein